jgi:putative hydrolase of the HAD superfamily
MRIAAISFDLDDTLWPIEPVLRRAEDRLHAWLWQHCPRAALAYPPAALRALRERMGREHPEWAHDYTALRLASLRHALLPLGYDEGHVQGAFAVFQTARNEVVCYADVRPVLRWLALQLPLVSVSNGNADVQRIGLAGYFRASLHARAVGVGKPAAEIFHAACARLGLPPEAVLHVGDDPEQDVLGARQAGLHSAWLNRRGVAWPSRGVAPRLVFRDLHELVRWLASDPVN